MRCFSSREGPTGPGRPLNIVARTANGLSAPWLPCKILGKSHDFASGFAQSPLTPKSPFSLARLLFNEMLSRLLGNSIHESVLCITSTESDASLGWMRGTVCFWATLTTLAAHHWLSPMLGNFRLRLGAVLLILCSACQKPAAEPPSGVVFVLLDALRADRLGCYGNPQDTSPNLDALARDSTIFLNAIAPAPWTLPTMASIWTSLNPSVHGATRMSNLLDANARPVGVLDESRTTLAEVLRDEGFKTAAFIDGSYPRKAFGMAQGFDVFVDATLPGIRLNVEALFDWLDRERPERFFAYIHTVDVRSPLFALQVEAAQRR